MVANGHWLSLSNTSVKLVGYGYQAATADTRTSQGNAERQTTSARAEYINDKGECTNLALQPRHLQVRALGSETRQECTTHRKKPRTLVVLKHLAQHPPRPNQKKKKKLNKLPELID